LGYDDSQGVEVTLPELKAVLGDGAAMGGARFTGEGWFTLN
jgi:hypothetical protein